MMLPFGMLADTPTRKEVCPMFGPTIIRRVLTSFVADEFCPDPVPQNIINALDTEEVSDASDEILTSLPCTASPTKYSPPPAAWRSWKTGSSEQPDYRHSRNLTLVMMN